MYAVTHAQITTPEVAGIPIAVPNTVKIQVQTMNETIDRILALSIPSVAFSSSHLRAAHTKKNTKMWMQVNIIE